MRLLLDTHVFLWWVENAPELSGKARKGLADPAHEVFLSLASCWEMAIKLSLGKLKVAHPLKRFIPEQLAANGFRQLSIEFRHVVRVAQLPFHHRAPFDRLLVAQALEEGVTVVSADPVFGMYGVRRLW